MKRPRLLPLTVLVTTAASWAGCDGSNGAPPGEGTPVAIRFAAKVGEAPFSCQATFAGVGAGADTLEPRDLRLYVHDLRLVDASGREWPVSLEQDGLWQSADVALLDFEDKTGTCANGTAPTHTVVRGTYEVGAGAVDITALRFRVGVPFAMNHGDMSTAPSPLNLSGMFWGWQGGYKFMRLDMRVQGAPDAGPNPHGEGNGVDIHLGSTGCTLSAGTQSVTACSGPNRPEITLDGFDPSEDTVVLDYAALVEGIDLGTYPYPSPVGDATIGCMSSKDDPECAIVFAHLGLSLDTGLPVGGQSAFRLE